MLVAVADRSQIAGARRTVVELATGLGLDESGRGRVGLIVTELATNLVKHAREGMLLARAFDDADGAGVEIMAIDKGPGIADVARALIDGVSTAGSPGQGLGAIKRQSDQFAVYAHPQGGGAAIMARVKGGASAGKDSPTTIGAVVDPYPGETACGDAWAYAETERGPTLFLADGMGHGPAAAAAAEGATKAFLSNAAQTCLVGAQNIHRALAPTRGAAIAVACVDAAEKTVRFIGVGNIAAMLVDGANVKRMVSNHGTAGHAAPRIREFAYSYERGCLLILHSDGLSQKWNLEDYPGLASAHPSLIAGVLFRDHRRGRDDAGVVAMRVAQ
jgi:anti-sigma regulatory factor (Ser/Thr protein kinase)